MPELPEVVALAEFLHTRLAGSVIADITVSSLNALQTYAPQPSSMHGLTVERVRHRGKVLLLDADGLTAAWHLYRAGWVRWSDSQPKTTLKPGRGPIAARFRFVDLPNTLLQDDDTAGFDLTEAGTKKRLALWIAHNDNDIPPVARLGIEPLSEEFTLQHFQQLLASKRQQIKGLLRDQQLIAGVGNAYSDEILHAARMSPFALSNSLTDETAGRLYQATIDTLTAAIASARGKPAAELKDAKRSAMAVHGRTGQPCPVCGDTVAEVSFADSSLQYCPTCQTGGKPLADRRMSRLLK